jgi:hypothetical protein
MVVLSLTLNSDFPYLSDGQYLHNIIQADDSKWSRL